MPIKEYCDNKRAFDFYVNPVTMEKPKMVAFDFRKDESELSKMFLEINLAE